MTDMGLHVTAHDWTTGEVVDLTAVDDLVDQGKLVAADLLEQAVRDRATAEALRGHLAARPAER